MLKQLAVGDTQLNVYEAGQGAPILFVHGFPLDHRMWLAQLEPFATSNRVIAPDLRGLGRSSLGGSAHRSSAIGTKEAGAGASTPSKVSMEQHADDLAALLDVLGINEQVTLVGLSMGGYVAFQFVHKFADRLARLVLVDSRAAPDTPEAAANRLKMADHVLRVGTEIVADAMLPRLFAPTMRERHPQVVEQVRQMILQAPPAGVAAAQFGMAERADARPWLPAIRVPTLVVCGTHDVISPPEEMRSIAAEIPGARYVEMPEAGHMSTMESPAEFNTALAAFLAS